jgi:hypothetical protein
MYCPHNQPSLRRGHQRIQRNRLRLGRCTILQSLRQLAVIPLITVESLGRGNVIDQIERPRRLAWVAFRLQRFTREDTRAFLGNPQQACAGRALVAVQQQILRAGYFSVSDVANRARRPCGSCRAQPSIPNPDVSCPYTSRSAHAFPPGVANAGDCPQPSLATCAARRKWQALPVLDIHDSSGAHAPSRDRKRVPPRPE